MEHDVTFTVISTGRSFIKDGKLYKLEGHVKSEQAYKSGLNYPGKAIAFKLTNEWGYPLRVEELYVPYFGEKCRACGMRQSCNGCSRCGTCRK